MNRKDFLKLMAMTGGIICIAPFISPLKSISGSRKEEQQERFTYLPHEKIFGVNQEEWAKRYESWLLSFDATKININHEFISHQPYQQMLFIPMTNYSDNYKVVNHRIQTTSTKAICFAALTNITDLSDTANFDKWYHRITGNPNNVYRNMGQTELLHTLSRTDIDYTKSIMVTLNGQGLPMHRIHTAEPFPITYAENNIGNFESKRILYPPGENTAIIDGYFVFLKPLPVGSYIIYVKAAGTGFQMEENEDYQKELFVSLEVV